MWPALFAPEMLDPSHEVVLPVQPASTCGQCRKSFNRQDNLLKHLQHCTGHRPPPPPQLPQQQHITTPPPTTFTVSHRYTPMGGDVKRYNIDMQETQHLYHLSPALHLLLPTMKTFQDKHHAYTFQVAITIVCHKAVIRVLLHNHQLP